MAINYPKCLAVIAVGVACYVTKSGMPLWALIIIF